MGRQELAQMSLSFLFFSFTISFLSFSLLLLLQKLFKPCCSCHLCKSYMDATWTSDFTNLQDWYSHLLASSPTQTIHIHVLGNTITSNPENVEYMLKTNFDNFPKGKTFSSILGDLLGKGIFNVDGELWRFQRKMASLVLGNVSVCNYAFAVASNEVQRRLLPFLSLADDRKAEVDLQEIFRRFSFDTVCRISFGIDPGCLELSLPVSEFAAAFDIASCLSAKRALSVAPVVWKIKRFLNIGSERDLRMAIRRVNALAEEVIRQRRKLGSDSNQLDLLSRFMCTVNDDVGYLRDMVISFLLAGRDTVASSLTAFFFLISSHPEVVEAIREEIDAVINVDHSHQKEAAAAVLSYDLIKSMNYVHAALHESLRLYPPVQFDSKFCLEDDILPDGTFVNKGTRVTYHPYAMGRNERIWGDDWHVFRPERWLKHGLFVAESPYKYPVFQGGARTCLGKEMALMEMKTVIVSVVRRFDVEVVGAQARALRFAPGLTATMSGGLQVRARRRAAGAC